MKIVKFVNFSDQPFSGVPYMWPEPKTKEVRETVDDHCKWNGMSESFQVGESKYMEDWKADHLAKHLINRELDKINRSVADITEREKMLKKCILAESLTETPETNVEIAVKNREAKIEVKKELISEIPVEEAKVANEKTAEIKKRGRPVKAKVETPVEFPDLNK